MSAVGDKKQNKHAEKAMAKPLGEAKVHKKQPVKKPNIRAMAERAKSLVVLARSAKEGAFLSVATDEKGKVTTTPVANPITADIGMAREYMKNALGSRPYKTTLVWDGTVQAGSANAVLTSQIGVDITNSADFTTLRDIFDEVRCLRWKARMLIGADSAPTALVAMFCASANVSPISFSVAGLLSSTKHVGPIPMQSFTSQALSTRQITPVTKFGFVELDSGPLERGATEANPSGNAPIQGDWIPTSATTGQAVCGYLHARIDALGTGNVAYIRPFFFVDVEYRLRL